MESLSCRQCLWERLRSINQCSLVCAQIQICCSRKPGISAVIFIPVVFLPKHRSGDCSWVEKSDLNFLVVPRLQVLAFMKNEFLMCNRFHTHCYFESPFMLYYIPKYSTQCCAFLLLLSFSLGLGPCFSSHVSHQGTLPWLIKLKLRFYGSGLIFPDLLAPQHTSDLSTKIPFPTHNIDSVRFPQAYPLSIQYCQFSILVLVFSWSKCFRLFRYYFFFF